MKIGNKVFDLHNHTYIMAILNVTPDSFSDGNSYQTIDDVLYRVEDMLSQGAHIIDVGGESTRPGHTVISDDEEIHRVVPAIEAITTRFDVPVSIDTYKYSVAEAALKSGAHMVNDIWGLQYAADTQHTMAQVIAKYDAACCLMHNQEQPVYQAFLPDCIAFLQKSTELALAFGIAADKIILDPGVGFGKTYEQNLDVMRNLTAFYNLNYPMLLGTSRKSMIGLALNLPIHERLEGTLVTTVMAVMAGWNFVRVHDIKENARAIQMAEAILYYGR
ncbi:MAG: dihydropteroate synthase [Peptococcaceae bacterium]|nr:dihydropteroate synthase [Peptococcaceae bacterium]